MADGVMGARHVKLHQALHGYAEGHREIASSIRLKPRDGKSMLVLSDVSGPGARIDDGGYLTGYPLVESGLYAFAKTWAAPEMPRPGCVWTHTLLIDFADLANLDSLTPLIGAFRRPQSDGHTNYTKPLHFDCSAEQSALCSSDESRARRILAALYGKPKVPIVTTRDIGLDVDRLVTALWSQQWPRLRRSFRFCTLAATDRSVEGATFDLQLLPPDNQAFRTRFPKAIEAQSVSASGVWLDKAIDDLMRPQRNGLRSFLRLVGGDVASGRAAFTPLCRLYGLIESFRSEPRSVGSAIDLLQDELGASQARSARALVANAALREAERLDESGLDYLLEHLDLIEASKLSTEGVAFGIVVLRRRPIAFASMAESADPIRALMAGTIASASSTDLITALATAPALAGTILRMRPELAVEPRLWARDLGIDEDAFAALRDAPIDWPRIIAAMMVAERTDLAHRVAGEAGPLAVLRAIASAVGSRLLPRGWDQWLQAAAQPGAVAELLSLPYPLPRQLLVLLTRTIGPDEIPNDYGEDPWLSAVRRADGAISAVDEAHLRAFLLARSLSWRSRNQAELAQFGFEPTHRAAADGDLLEESWRWLDGRLPWSMLWFDWDRCQRLRAGVANLFVERELSPEVFGHLVQDGSLFGAMAEQVARSSKGRNYLRHVRRALKDSTDDLSSARRHQIERLVK